VSLEVTAFTLLKLSAWEGPTSKIPMTRTKATGILAIECSMDIAWRMIMVAKTSMAKKGPAKSVNMATIGRRTQSVEITAWWDGTWSGTLLAVSLGVSCLFPFFAVSARHAVVQNPRKTRNSKSLKKIRIDPFNQDKAIANPRSLLTLRLDMALKEAINKVIKEAINKVIKVGKDLLDLNSVFVKRLVSCDPDSNLWRFFG
jgi:hypothetical protein